MPNPHATGTAPAAFDQRPPVASATLRRERLEALLDEGFGKRLIVVVAGPGFGKTTLLSSWCSDVATAWCSLSDREPGLGALAREIGERLRPWLPEPLSRTSLLEALAQPSASAERADTFAAVLSAALERALRHDLVLVLEDVHEVAPGSAAARLLESLCKQVPALVHVVTSSREPLPFAIERLRGRGELLELTSGDLAFTVGEVHELSLELGLTLDEPSTERLHETTGGWPAAVRLVLETMRRTGAQLDLEARVEPLLRPQGTLYAYLAEEVFRHDAPEVRDLLRACAPFERVTRSLCDALGCAQPDVLGHLARRGLATERSDGWFAVHRLVRDFASRAWPLTAAETAEMHRRAAAWFEANGYDEEALRHLGEAHDRMGVAQLLSRCGAALLARGAAEAVVEYGRLAGDALDAKAEEALGEAYTVVGDSDRALLHLGRAAAGATSLSASVAWRTVVAYHLQDDLERAAAVRARARLDDATPYDRALLLAWSAAVERRLGHPAEATRLAEGALEAAAESGDDRALALAYVASALASEGEGRDPLPQLERALSAAERTGDVFQRARIHNNRGSVLLESGDYQRAMAELDAALQLAELGGFTTLVALATMNRALCHYCLGRLDEADADYEAAFTAYRRTGSREVAYALIGLGDVHRERGDVAQAKSAYEEGLALGERSGDRQALVPGLYQLAKVIVDDEPERAVSLSERAIEYGWPDLAWALNAHGWVMLALGDRAAAAEAAERAAASAAERRDPFGLAESLELSALSAAQSAAAASHLEEALSMWRKCGNAVHEAAVELALARFAPGAETRRAAGRAARRLRALGVRSSATGPAGLLRFVAERSAAPLAIETLGGFRVLRDGVPVPHGAWQSQKARDLLKILVARRGAATPRELLMDALWPGDEPGKVGNRLSVALNTVHSVLDPGKEHEPGHFVWADRRAVGLDLSHAAVDVDEFLAEAAEGLELHVSGATGAHERLEHAFALYRGDFLEGDAYEDWAASLREEARAAFVDVAHALAEDASEEDRHEEAARYALRLLDRDPYDEKAHLKLVASLGAAGRHGEARRRYGMYRRRMEEIGVEAAVFPAPRRAEARP